MALQALLEAQQRQNELLKQSLQHQQPPHPASQPASAGVTVNRLTSTSFSPTVITVGHPGPPEPVAAAASTTHRAAVSHGAVYPAGHDVRLQVPADVVVSTDGAVARSRSRSPSSDRLVNVERGVDAVETLNEPAVQVVVQ